MEKAGNKMTLRQDQFVERLPKNGYNVSKTAKEVGYSEKYATHSIHSDIGKSCNWKDRLEKIFSPEMVKKDIIQHKKRLKKAKDNTNYSRMLELETKILGMQVDKSEVRTTPLTEIRITNVKTESYDNQDTLHNRISDKKELIQPIENK